MGRVLTSGPVRNSVRRPPRAAPAAALALSLFFLIAHIAALPPTLEDIDSINFALGVRDFDVALHQPHPPGYPLFIALAKTSAAAFRAAGVDAPEVAGLAVWGPLSGALLLMAAFAFFRSLAGDHTTAVLAVVLLAVSPLFWFTALRPLSDMAGLAVAFVALACLMAAAVDASPDWTAGRTRLLIAGAAVAGLSAGFRVQMAVLTVPLLVFAVSWPRSPAPPGVRLAAVAAAGAAVVLWAGPLLIATGGPAAYLQALGSQAGEDFSGVVMLWTNPGLLVAVRALLHTFVLPWDSPALGGAVLALASAGTLVLLVRRPPVLLMLGIVFGPYAVFHLLFQETVTVRYALPLVPPVAYLAAIVFAEARSSVALAMSAVIVVASLAQAVPAAMAFGRTPSPVFALLSEMELLGARGTQPLVAMHRRVLSETRRARQWNGGVPGRLLEAPRDYEWLELTRTWREGNDSEAWFIAHPGRTDLALIDAEHRRTREYRWPFDPAVYVGGARPSELDWHIYSEPGWFLEQGWALTPEIAGISARDGLGPHREPSVGWVRRRPGEVRMMTGGRHLGAPTDPPVRIVAAIDGRVVSTFDVESGFFLKFDMLPAGALHGEGTFAKLTIQAESPGPGDTPPVALEQFNLQSPDVVQFGFDEGWHEPEHNPRTSRSWRWMSESAALKIAAADRNVTLRIRGESPRRYYDTATLRVSVGGAVVAEATPRTDFIVEAAIPARLLAAADGRILLESDRVFIPGEREGSADRRRLGLRIYSVEVR